MPLLEEDIRRLIDLGFKEQFFATPSGGFKVLKNSEEGRCVFHDGKQCTIYENRPAGCKLYPIIFDEGSRRPVKDELCPFRSEFDISSRAKRELSGVYFKLTSERRARKLEKKS